VRGKNSNDDTCFHSNATEALTAKFNETAFQTGENTIRPPVMVLGDISYACMQASSDLAYGARVHCPPPSHRRTGEKTRG
jgi:hypothetical protein